MKKLVALFVSLGLLMYFGMNSQLIMDQTMKWADKNTENPDAPEVIMRAAVWCDITGGDRQAMELYRTVWERYPKAAPYCAQALYETAYIVSQGTARMNANQYLQKIFDEYADQEKWRLKAKALWDEVNHVI